MRSAFQRAGLRTTALFVAALSAVGSAHADFVRFEADNYAATSGGNGFQVVDVYAVFEASSDRLLNCFNVDLDIVGAVTSNFYQASIPSVWPASGLPALVILNSDLFAYDTFVTIGAPQGELTNGTTGDPSFDDASFLATGSINTPAGWYNLPPSNGWGDAGGDLRVLLGRFTIEDQHWQTGSRITWSATVGYISGGQTKFNAESRTFFFPTVAVSADLAPEDMDGDSKGDLVWHDPTAGNLRFWKVDGLSLVSSTTLAASVPSTLVPQGSGDVDGDGDPDFIFRASNGDIVVHFTQAGNTTSSATIAAGIASAWVVAAIGDLDGDGRADIVVRNTSTNEVRGWLMDAQFRWRTGTIGTATNLEFLTGCDLNGNGTMDLVFRTSTGQVHAWLVDGLETTFTGPVANSGLVPSNWSVISNGDLDGNGTADLIWRNSTNGNVNGWLMNGAARTAGGLISAGVPNNWQPIATLDLDGDGDDDVVWRNGTNNNINGWLMQGLVKASGGNMGTTNANWAPVIR